MQKTKAMRKKTKRKRYCVLLANVWNGLSWSMTEKWIYQMLKLVNWPKRNDWWKWDEYCRAFAEMLCDLFIVCLRMHWMYVCVCVLCLCIILWDCVRVDNSITFKDTCHIIVVVVVDSVVRFKSQRAFICNYSPWIQQKQNTQNCTCTK